MPRFKIKNNQISKQLSLAYNSPHLTNKNWKIGKLED